MSISTVRLEPDYPTNLPTMVWSQGPELITRMIAEIDAETQSIDVVSYRLTVPELTDALIRRHRAGVQVRVFIEPTQYRNSAFPEYWLVGAMVDRLWAAGVPIRERTHQGLMHMKTLITSRTAMIASSNFTRYWQRDHNYFVSPAANPSTYLAMKDRFSAMWNDGVNYRTFQPQRPAFVDLQAPATGAANVPTSSALVWNRAPWAVAFDVYIGASPDTMALAGRVNAVMTDDPPATYAFMPPQGLQPSTRYYWRVIPRTYATDVNPGLTSSSEIFTFVTGATATPPAGGTTPPPPTTDAPTSACLSPSPAPGWVCISGGWVPATHPLAAGAAPPPPVPSAPIVPVPPAPSTCTSIKPASNWVCVNGGWVPPDSPLAVGAPAPAPQAPAPVPAPPVPPSTGSCSIPDPFVSIGGGVCIGGGWVPRAFFLPGGGGV